MILTATSVYPPKNPGVFGLIGCQSPSPGLALPIFFNNNNNAYNSVRWACLVSRAPMRERGDASFSMAIGNGEFMYECVPKHKSMGTARMKKIKKQKMKARREALVWKIQWVGKKSHDGLSLHNQNTLIKIIYYFTRGDRIILPPICMESKAGSKIIMSRWRKYSSG